MSAASAAIGWTQEDDTHPLTYRNELPTTMWPSRITSQKPIYTKSTGNEEETNMLNRRGSFTAVLAGSALAAAAGSVPAQAAEGETGWDQIHRTKTLRYGAITYPPYWSKDRETGKWSGALVEMAEDIAKVLGVEPMPVETTWAACVLDLQSNKTDLQFALQATPTRALSLDFAGPTYQIGWYAINRPGFAAKTWADYNRPEVRLAVVIGTSDVVILQKMAPRATRVELPGISEAALSVSAGRADALITTVMGALVAKSKNPGLGEFVLPTPYVTLPAYIGLRRESDDSLRKFLLAWSEWNNLLGYNEQRLKKNMASAGVTEIPDNVRF
jgi:polar amino acid transport system substrate-binding protein